MSRDKGGYGLIAVGQKRKRGAHIVAWEVANGRKVPAEALVRHRCDNPPCTNPAHLELGSHSDNANDRVERDRHVAASGYRSRTDEEVSEIRRLAAEGIPRAHLAEQFGCSHGTINRIISQQVFPEGKPRGHAVKLDETSVRRIRELRSLGYTQQRIADEYGLNQSTVSAILARKVWGHVT
ncbi:HNH endonuclease [Mycobacterium sp. C3-094]